MPQESKQAPHPAIESTAPARRQRLYLEKRPLRERQVSRNRKKDERNEIPIHRVQKKRGGSCFLLVS